MLHDKLILEIDDLDFDPEYKMGDTTQFKTRNAVRGILIREDKIALLNVTRFNYHKLPGGGVEKGETIKQAFLREVLEEVGFNSNVFSYLGHIIEWRDQFNLKQTSEIVAGQVIGKIGPNKLEPSEVEEGFKVEWVPLKDAEQILLKDQPANYEGQFIVKRDLAIIREYTRGQN
jgi:8-oxo-dGTP pyrophosphatase MutT (NUDIX family)